MHHIEAACVASWLLLVVVVGLAVLRSNRKGINEDGPLLPGKDPSHRAVLRSNRKKHQQGRPLPNGKGLPSVEPYCEAIAKE